MNKMTKYLIVAALLLVTTVVSATNLRGRVDGFPPYASAPFPVPGANVQLVVPDGLGGVRAISGYITGPDGMYYFQNIPPGNYQLVVNGIFYPLFVGNMYLQDIPPVLLR